MRLIAALLTLVAALLFILSIIVWKDGVVAVLPFIPF